MNRETFKKEAACMENPKWAACIAREEPIYQRPYEIRSEFWRDYNRLLHSKAYRRLKHKTQVFHAAGNDHICTRIEHVNHVCAVSYTICSYLGLNTELALAIGIGHDIGHAPFGHDGEHILNKLCRQYACGHFYHEGNGLFFADRIELLQNQKGDYSHLNLTYAVRDGIVCHCGEVDQNSIFPREDVVPLSGIDKANALAPFTWEACVVKVSDKISYLGRDLEDAVRLKLLEPSQLEELMMIERRHWGNNMPGSTNTALIHSFVIDLCQHSTPAEGICFSRPCFETISRIKEFNYKYIYSHQRLKYYSAFAEVVINNIFDVCFRTYDRDRAKLLQNIGRQQEVFPKLMQSFLQWLRQYADIGDGANAVFRLDTEEQFARNIVLFISSMSDTFALEMFNELTTF